MWIRYFSLPFVLKIEIKKKSVTLVKLSPMHAYLVVCALKKILSSGEGLNQPTQDFCVATRVITKIFLTCKAVVTKKKYMGRRPLMCSNEV